MTEHHYCYRSKPYTLAEFDLTVGHQFRKYVEAVSSIDERTKRQLQSAIHWYGISITVDDPAVSYVAAWTDLECIGTAIDRAAHPNGPKAPCKVCGNTVGKDRDRKMAGIDHMLNRLYFGPLADSMSEEARNRLEKDSLRSLSLDEAHELRNDIVHCLGQIDHLLQSSVRHRRFLLHVFNASIQALMGQHVKFWMPGEYEFHPEIRHSLKFREGLIRDPYCEEWVADMGCKAAEPSFQKGKRAYVGDVDVVLELSGAAAQFIEFQSEELFRRDVDVCNVISETKTVGISSWDDRTAEPQWVEYAYPALEPETN